MCLMYVYGAPTGMSCLSAASYILVILIAVNCNNLYLI